MKTKDEIRRAIIRGSGAIDKSASGIIMTDSGGTIYGKSIRYAAGKLFNHGLGYARLESVHSSESRWVIGDDNNIVIVVSGEIE